MIFLSFSVFPQDLGLQGTSLNDILYKNAAFLNLVDPISHELLLSLAKDMQCPKRVSPSYRLAVDLDLLSRAVVREHQMRSGTENRTFRNPQLQGSIQEHVHDGQSF